MIIQLPEDIPFYYTHLAGCRHEAYAVGGCVRDSLLSRTPDDWDITTSARPEETSAVPPHHRYGNPARHRDCHAEKKRL